MGELGRKRRKGWGVGEASWFPVFSVKLWPSQLKPKKGHITRCKILLFSETVMKMFVRGGFGWRTLEDISISIIFAFLSFPFLSFLSNSFFPFLFFLLHKFWSTWAIQWPWMPTTERHTIWVAQTLPSPRWGAKSLSLFPLFCNERNF